MSEPYLTVEWQPLLNAGFPLRDPHDEPTPVLTVEWGPKLGTSWYAYDDEDAEEPGRH
ncbi:hypothetical protein ACFOOK_23550 [Micromonospora krabiensis]|uniref:Uncharacterized protein n=1 Tax=Micromonospora krabiensis TaxID=307121 RepID=A0A1C3N797_9ACTN|nr:hypothetical protein [Micromonospora krabiensis]SBV28459.1 hypothetical protein GA0070620_4002 [Micromonospora krabiensis]